MMLGEVAWLVLRVGAGVRLRLRQKLSIILYKKAVKELAQPDDEWDTIALLILYFIIPANK
jgi:hypothetical protein